MKMKVINLVVLFVLHFMETNSYFDEDVNFECKGKKYENVTLTAYYPDYNDDENVGGYLDKNGKKLRTLQDYLDDRSDFITLAMDETLGIPYATSVCIPELNAHFGHRLRIEIRDTSSDLYGTGFTRADICVRSETDSYDITVNKEVTLVVDLNDSKRKIEK